MKLYLSGLPRHPFGRWRPGKRNCRYVTSRFVLAFVFFIAFQYCINGVSLRNPTQTSQSSPSSQSAASRFLNFVRAYIHPGVFRSPCGFQYPWLKRDGKFTLQDVQENSYFVDRGSLKCLHEGTDIAALQRLKVDASVSCPCRTGWSGDHCSVPGFVRDSLPRDYPLKVSGKPTRIINAFPFHNEFDALESRFADLADLVDVFLVLESNFTSSGLAKPLALLDRLRAGMYPEVACKIVHVVLDYFPAEAYTDGWAIDNLLRNHIAQHGLRKQIVGYDKSDLFLLSDADELPKREVLVFLKVHTGYPIPIGFNLRGTVFGYYWAPSVSRRATVHVPSVVTVGFLQEVFKDNAIFIRDAPHQMTSHVNLSNKYQTTSGQPVSFWRMGNTLQPAGWHCSWCCDVTCIRAKLHAAPNSDFPRWGNYPEKSDENYIKCLIKTGRWFDGRTTFLERSIARQRDDYAPRHFLQNRDKYGHLLVNPFTSPEVDSRRCAQTRQRPSGPLIG